MIINYILLVEKLYYVKMGCVQCFFPSIFYFMLYILTSRKFSYYAALVLFWVLYHTDSCKQVLCVKWKNSLFYLFFIKFCEMVIMIYTTSCSTKSLWNCCNVGQVLFEHFISYQITAFILRERNTVKFSKIFFLFWGGDTR